MNKTQSSLQERCAKSYFNVQKRFAKTFAQKITLKKIKHGTK
jgi:hypothetical protein